MMKYLLPRQDLDRVKGCWDFEFEKDTASFPSLIHDKLGFFHASLICSNNIQDI